MISHIANYSDAASRSNKVNSHVIGKCRWDSVFDDHSMSYQLQEYLSYFSQTMLLQIFQKVFDQHIPVSQTFRVETLVLDLGVLQIDDLETQLSKEIETSLSQQLLNLLRWREPNLKRVDSNDKKASHNQTQAQLLNNDQSLRGFIQTFLSTGTAPWWYRGALTNEQIFLNQLANSPKELASTLRVVGSSEAVRKRILWQWRDDGAEKIVRLLEPAHHHNILSFALQFSRMHIALSDTDSERNEFRQRLMSWILTFIIQERGAQFHNDAYIEFLLRKYAAAYKVKHSRLLQHVQEQAQDSHIESVISAHSHEIGKQLLPPQQRKSKPDDSAAITASDNWNQLEGLLNAGYNDSNASRRLRELLCKLQEEDGVKLLDALRIISRRGRVSRNLATALDHKGKVSIVALLSPSNELFIPGYARRIETVVKRRKCSPEVIWEVIFAHLLNQSGSSFNRQQFIHRTLAQLSRENGLSYQELLVMILESTSRSQRGHSLSGGESFELTRILIALSEKLPKQTHSLIESADSTIDCYLQAVLHFLSSGEIRRVSNRQKLPDLNQMLSVLLVQRPRRLAEMAKLLISQNDNNASAEKTLLDRMNALLSVENYALLRSAIAPSIDDFLGIFSGQVMSWYGNGWLPALKGFDCYQHLQSSVLFTLILDSKHGGSIEVFLPSFLKILNRQYGVDPKRLTAELNQCLAKRSPVGKFDAELSDCLELVKTVVPLVTKVPPKQDLYSKSSPQTSRLMIAMLRASDRQKTNAEDQRSFARLVKSLTAADFESFLLRTADQVDRSVILRSMLSKIKFLPLHQSAFFRQQSSLLFSQKMIELLCAAFKHSRQGLYSSALMKTDLMRLIRLCEWDNMLDKRESNAAAINRRLIQNVVMASCYEFGVRLDDFINALRVGNQTAHVNEIDKAIDQLSSSLSNKNSNNEESKATQYSTFEIDIDRKYLDHPLADKVFLSLLHYGRMPLWMNTTEPIDAKRFCNDLLEYQPQRSKSLLTKIGSSPMAEIRLNNLISYEQLLAAIMQTKAQPYSQLKMLENFYHGLAKLTVHGVNASVLQTLLFQQTIRCWLNNDWNSMTAKRIATHFSAEVKKAFAVDPTEFGEQLAQHKKHFPVVMRIQSDTSPPIAHAKQVDHALIKLHEPIKTKQINNNPESKSVLLEQPIAIENAGLVILQDFMKTYFERLELIDNGEFISPKEQRAAVHHLQYLVTGQHHTDEQHLVLNKLICGLDITNPIETSVDQDAETRAKNTETADSLIDAMIQYWSAIGSSSIDGFRGNWLVRQGSLREHSGHWDLIVEAKPYDVLLQQIPVSFSIIKHPWMHKPINVSWPT